MKQAHNGTAGGVGSCCFMDSMDDMNLMDRVVHGVHSVHETTSHRAWAIIGMPPFGRRVTLGLSPIWWPGFSSKRHF